MRLLESGAAEYKRAFELSLTLGRGGPDLADRLRRLTAGLPRREVAVDWGAGTGRGTALLCDLFTRVYAVEPSEEMRASLGTTAPSAILLDGDLATAKLPEPVDFGLINHVYYHIPEEDWGPQTLRCAEHLSERGLLCISLKHPNAGCGDMFEHFGAPRFDLYSLVPSFRNQNGYALEFVNTPGCIEITSFEDTLTIARFMLSDRPASAFSRLGSEADLQEYVRSHLWDEATGRGGWNNPKVYALVRRNPLL